MDQLPEEMSPFAQRVIEGRKSGKNYFYIE